MHSFKKLGYVQLARDGALFKYVTQVNGEEHVKIVLVYVDDLLFMSSDQNSCRKKVKNSQVYLKALTKET